MGVGAGAAVPPLGGEPPAAGVDEPPEEPPEEHPDSASATNRQSDRGRVRLKMGPRRGLPDVAARGWFSCVCLCRYTARRAVQEPTIEAVQIPCPRVLLRELCEEDAGSVHSWECDPEVVRFLHHGVRSLEQTQASIMRSQTAARRAPRMVYDLAIENPADGRLLGSCGLELKLACRQAPRVYEAGLWYVLARHAWHQGYASEACRALLQFGFDNLRLQRVFLEVDPENRPSVKVARGLGLRQEAHFRQNFWFKGAWCDTLVFARLAGET